MTELKDNVVPISLMILSFLGLTAGLYWMKPVMVPFVFSVFLYFVTAPVLSYLKQRLKLPKTLALFVTFLLLLVLFLGLLTLLGFSLAEFISSSDAYQQKLLAFVDQIAGVLAHFGVKLDISLIQAYVRELPFAAWIQSFSGGVVEVVGNFVLVFIFTFFLVVGKKDVQSPKSLFNERVQQRITRYVATKFFMSTVTGTLVGILLALFGVQLALLFGVLTFFLNFIPNIGSIIAILLPLPVVFLQFGFGIWFILALAIPGGIQFVIGNIIEPRLQGRHLGLHPAMVLLSLLFWGFVWGVPGMFLAVPMTAVIKLVMERSRHTRIAARWLEGKFA